MDTALHPYLLSALLTLLIRSQNMISTYAMYLTPILLPEENTPFFWPSGLRAALLDHFPNFAAFHWSNQS